MFIFHFIQPIPEKNILSMRRNMIVTWATVKGLLIRFDPIPTIRFNQTGKQWDEQNEL